MNHMNFFMVVKGDSMNPTLKNGQLIFIDQTDQEYYNNDIVVFKKNEDIYVKRIIANNGYYFVDLNYDLEDSAVLYSYISEEEYKKTLNFPSSALSNYVFIKLENQYWMRGDNTRNSTNSEIFGPVEKEEIIGKVIGHS